MSNTNNAASRPYPTLEETVDGLFKAAKRLPKDVEQTEYTPRNEVIFYDFIADRMTTSPTFGRTVYVEVRNPSHRFNNLEREAALKHLKSRIKANSAEIAERVMSGMGSKYMHWDLMPERPRSLTYTVYKLMDEVEAESTPLRTLHSLGTVMAFHGYVHPDAISDQQIDEFIINWPNYRELAASGNVLFQQVCSVPTIVARIEDRMKSIHTSLVNEVLPECLAIGFSDLGKSGLTPEFHGRPGRLFRDLFSKEEIMDAVTKIDSYELGERGRFSEDAYASALDSDDQIFRVASILSKKGGVIDHDGVRRWVRTALAKAPRHIRFDYQAADYCGTHTADLLRSAKRLGVDDYAVEINPSAEFPRWHPSTWGAPLAIRLTKAIEGDPSITLLQVVENLMSELDTAEVDCYVDEDGKAFVEANGLGDQFPLIHKAKTYSRDNIINEGLSIVRLT